MVANDEAGDEAIEGMYVGTHNLAVGITTAARRHKQLPAGRGAVSTRGDQRSEVRLVYFRGWSPRERLLQW